MRDHGVREHERQRGQGLVEFTLVLPIILVLVLSVAELGLIFGKLSSLGYGTREGARTGSALAQGYIDDCIADPGNNKVDAVLVAAVQRILKSPDAGIDLRKVQEIRIFKASSPSGAETPGRVNIWTYAGPGMGPEVDPGPGAAYLDFVPGMVGWPACDRLDGTPVGPIDSIGVTIKYTYDFVTPFPSVVNAIFGGNLSPTLTETTVMAVNPTY